MTYRLTLYIRSGCSLCEEMQRELHAVVSGVSGLHVETVDVDSKAQWIQEYGHKVPVLTADSGEEICHYFLDRQALDAYFSTH